MRALPLVVAFVLVAPWCSGQVIGTGSVLPWATVGEAYSQILTVSGGAPPYTWALGSGALPPGVNLAPSGLLSGAPTQDGAFYFTARVTDSSGQSASKAFGLVVILPPTPTISITGLADTLGPAEQPEFDLQPSWAYFRDIAGSMTLTFEPNTVNWSDDPAVQFSTGGRTLNFTIPAGQTTATWSSLPALQTGSVAGKLKLRLQYSAGGQNLTPLFAPVRSLIIARAAPLIESVQVVRTTSGFNLLIAGYSTPREITEADFEFTYGRAGDSRTTSVTVPLETNFTAWYTSESAARFGSAFLYTQPFTVQGSSSAITSVSVTLVNSTGTSEAVTASF